MRISEKIIQEYIWKNKNNLYELFEEVEFPKLIEKEKPWELEPSEIIFNVIISKYKELWEEVKLINLFGCEVPLKKSDDSTMRADFLANFEGLNGIGIIELKKSTQTERQSFTELLGYGSHIRTLFAPMSKLDITYILIAPMKERIVRESVINKLLYEQINTFALIPTYDENNINSLKLKPWIPNLNEIKNLIREVLHEDNFVIFKVVWDGLIGDWSPKNKGEFATQKMKDRMNIVSSYTAQLMEERGINGFCYSSQVYSEQRDYHGHLTNAINIVGLNPYRATKYRYLQEIIENYSINDFSVKINEIIPEIENKYHKNHDTEDIFEQLESDWSESIVKLGFEVVDTLTKSIEDKFIEDSYREFNWSDFQKDWAENSDIYKFNIHPTGILRKLYTEYLKLDYNYIREYGCDEHPICYETDDIPIYLVDSVANHYMFYNFLERLSAEISNKYEETNNLP